MAEATWHKIERLALCQMEIAAEERWLEIEHCGILWVHHGQTHKHSWHEDLASDITLNKNHCYYNPTRKRKYSIKTIITASANRPLILDSYNDADHSLSETLKPRKNILNLRQKLANVKILFKP
ncbi:unnamed protein product [Pieris macdunnoughi]|uniref:Uncharacterized protein n=1 Tax=Pieris macdunnoughi TaxID=345717 RepID=A0A821RH28_9NEOP|nr:unnamed protein product [Pieris macdunnoughi]